MTNPELNGLKGWLLLVGLGVIVSPIRLALTYYPLYAGIFTDGSWTSLTTPDSEFYIPYFGALLIGEMLCNCFMFALSVYLVYLYFSKSYRFPKAFIGLVLYSIGFILLDAWVVSVVVEDTPMFDEATLGEFMRSVLVGLVWIPYMFKSERVKATFVEGAPSTAIAA